MAKEIKTKKDIMIAVLMAFVFLIVLDLSPVGGNIQFYTKWIGCGSRPVSTRLGGGIASAGVPNYGFATSFGFFRSVTPYFCSPIEAERAGYSASSEDYEFPNLPASEFQDAIKKSRNL